MIINLSNKAKSGQMGVRAAETIYRTNQRTTQVTETNVWLSQNCHYLSYEMPWQQSRRFLYWYFTKGLRQRRH